MKKKVSALDALFATIFVICSAAIIFFISSNINSDILNPIAKTFGDFKLTDIYYSHIKESPSESGEIVMINIGDLPRDGIAEIINILNKHEPKAIGIDAFFRHTKDPAGDSLLAEAFSKTKNLVLVSELFENDKTSKIDSIGYSHPMFMKYAQPGFADMITAGHGYFKVARECDPVEEVNNEKIYSFPVKLAQIYDPKAAEKFLSRGNDFEEINFQGNIITHEEGASKNSKNVFSVLDWNQVLEGHFEPEAIKGKIIIMGFMGSYLGDPSWEDKFFTPLNENYLGKTNPDMFGVVVHANIVAMILKQSYINQMPEALDYFLSLIFIYLNVWLFSWMFLNLEEWWDGASLIISLTAVLMLTIVTFIIFHLYSFKYELTLPMLGLFLSGNLIEIYFAIILPAGRKFLRKSNVSLDSNKNPENQLETKKTTETYEL